MTIIECGCISSGGKKLSKTFSRRIIWRDLAYWQLHHWPYMAVKSIRQHYEGQVSFSLIYVSRLPGNIFTPCFASYTSTYSGVRLYYLSSRDKAQRAGAEHSEITL